MKLKRLKKGAIKLTLGKRDLRELKDIFGKDLSVYNTEFIDYLTECVGYELVEYGQDKEDIVLADFAIKKKNKKKKGYAYFMPGVGSEKSKKDYYVVFQDIKQLLKFCATLDPNVFSALYKEDNDYILYIKEKCTKKKEWKAIEFMGRVERDPFHIQYTIEECEALIKENAIQKLACVQKGEKIE